MTKQRHRWVVILILVLLTFAVSNNSVLKTTPIHSVVQQHATAAFSAYKLSPQQLRLSFPAVATTDDAQDNSDEPEQVALRDQQPSRGDDNYEGPRADQLPISMLLGLSHHKTGTYQMSCLFKHLANATGLRNPEPPSCLVDNGATATHISACLDSTPTPGQPALFKTYHTLQHNCTRTQSNPPRWTPCPTFMIYRQCKQQEVEGIRQESPECTVDLPISGNDASGTRFVAFHFVRNPIDAVLSAYTFHVSGPKSEPWLFKPRPLRRYRDELRWLGAGKTVLGMLGLDVQQQATEEEIRNEISYLDLLRSLPQERGIILQFWHSLPELLSMERQARSLSARLLQDNVMLRFESLRDAYNATMVDALSRISPILGSGDGATNVVDVLEATVTGGCDPGTWSDAQKASSTHVTTGKGNKEELQTLLFRYGPARRVLCAICRALDYQDDRCAEDRDPCRIEALDVCFRTAKR
jgi:hypothetical protein